MENNSYSTEVYFAAANSFRGFKSNFDKVFSPLRLDKLYVLKGGPGTGKSTLMRSIADFFDGSAKVTKILCSSDTKSLDGVLIEKNGVIVGVADGTSPHVIEPRFPGAVEEIVNLGEGFNYRSLISLRGEVSELSEKKGLAYKKAAEALENAGVVHRLIGGILSNNDIYKKAESVALELIKSEKNSQNNVASSSFYLSAFSKDGYTTIPLFKAKKEMISIAGDGVSEYVVMRELHDKLREMGASKCVVTSPLSDDMIDAVETESRVYTVSKENDSGCDVRSLLNCVKGYSGLKEAYDIILNDAAETFKVASKYHFALEEIYSRNMTFESNEDKLSHIKNQITELFDK